MIDLICDEKEDKEYTAVFLENDCLRIMVLPEPGDAFSAQDKTNGYDFVYYNEVIKHASVGPAGPWISGDIEFNWPQHHRLPYKYVAYVKNASREVLLNLKIVNGTAEDPDARVKLSGREDVLCDRMVTISRINVFRARIPHRCRGDRAYTGCLRQGGRRMLSCRPQPKKIGRMPEPMTPAKLPGENATDEGLCLNGLHIEHYRHASFLPDPYCPEGLKRGPGDSRINNAYGALLLRRGCFAESEKSFRAAIECLALHNHNSYDSEPYTKLSLCLLYQGRNGKTEGSPRHLPQIICHGVTPQSATLTAPLKGAIGSPVPLASPLRER